eukprot:206233-Prorocentrum_lima.AAC.1
MEPDTDTDSDDASLDNDEEYRMMRDGAGDAQSRLELGEHLCEAYFQAKRQLHQQTPARPATSGISPMLDV